MAGDDDELLFGAEEDETGLPIGELPADYLEPWVILVVDDDEQIHAMTRLLLKKFVFQGRSAELLSAQTAMEGGKADDDETFVEEVTAGLEALKVSAPVKKLLMALTLRAPVPELNAEETQALLAQRPIVPIRDVEEAAPPLVISSAGF